MNPLGGNIYPASEGGFPLGERLKRLRLQLGISQRELARRAAITNGNLSQIENGAVSPSFVTLEKILQALKVTPAQFFAEYSAWIPAVIRANDWQLVVKNSVKFAVFPLTEVQEPRVYLVEQTLPAGASINTSWQGHDGIVAGRVVAGELCLTLDGAEFTLMVGDGFHFSQHRRFVFANHAAVPCVLIGITIG